jgi:heme a synthase
MSLSNNEVVLNTSIRKSVKIWLIIGVGMLLVQILIGGVTRLTGSGLSITKWEIITGSIPPLNDGTWMVEFEKYKLTPQYQKINEGMSLNDFKFIYFWEYFHRLWARWMGLVFLFPFLYFYRKGWLPSVVIKRLGKVVLLAALAASFGWIMVASGLINRPWVNAYKLTLHLTIAFSVLAYLLWTTFHVIIEKITIPNITMLKNLALFMSAIAIVQFMLGGVMSGMKAALSHPTWPDLHGEYLPAILLDSKSWSVYNYVNYDKSAFMPTLVQFLHRNFAYSLTAIIVFFSYFSLKNVKTTIFRNTIIMLVILLVIQVLLGIFTLLYSQFKIPVVLGSLHQMVGVMLLSVILFIDFLLFSTKRLKL